MGQDQARAGRSSTTPAALPWSVRRQTATSLLLHFAKQPFDPALELPFQLGAVHHHDHRRGAELLPAFQNQAGGGEQGEGLAGALGMPDEPALLLSLGAACDDGVDGAPLMLPKHRFPRLAVFDVEKDPVAQGAQEIGGFEERLHREAVAFPAGVPSSAP